VNKALLFGSMTVLGGVLLGAVAGHGSDKGVMKADAPAARLITQTQYVNTLEVIFGPGLRFSPKFAPIPRVDGLVAVGTSGAIMTSGALDQFDTVARVVAEQATSPQNRDFLIPCQPKAENAPDDKCAGEFLTRVGELLFRRPLSSAESKAYIAVAHQSAERMQDFYRGLAVTLSSLLVAPEFLYVTQPVENARGQTRLTGLGKASRLSLLLWNSYPDDALLKAAVSGQLDTPKGLTAQIDRMLASPRLEAGVRSFFEDMLVFEKFDSLAKDVATFPAFTHKVAEDAREQTLRTIVAHIVHENGDYRDLFTTRKTFLTNDLGAIYGVKTTNPQGWTPYEFPANDPRGGILTQLSFTALYAQPARSSPTLRGKAIREIFLCQKVPHPPPNVDFSKLENPDPAHKTARQRLTAHQANPVCAGCHKITDPIGLALENFDGAGFYRSEEDKAKIDASGSLDGAAFADAQGLARAMRDSSRAVDCLTRRIMSYAAGRPLTGNDDAWVKKVGEDFAQRGYRVKDLMRTIATSEKFFAVEATVVKAVEAKESNAPESVQKAGSES